MALSSALSVSEPSASRQWSIWSWIRARLALAMALSTALKLLSDIDAGLTVLNHSDDRAEMAFGTFQPGNHLAVACVGVFICHRVTLSSPGG